MQSFRQFITENTNPKPIWKMSKEEFLDAISLGGKYDEKTNTWSKPIKNYKFASHVPSHAESHIAWFTPGRDFDSGIVTLTDSFFEHGERDREDIIKHEEGHRVESEVPPEIKAQIFDDEVLMAYSGRNIDEKLANWIAHGKPLPKYIKDSLPPHVKAKVK